MEQQLEQEQLVEKNEENDEDQLEPLIDLKTANNNIDSPLSDVLEEFAHKFVLYQKYII